MRWLVRAVATLVMLLVLLGGMAVLMPKDAVLDLAARRFAEATGRQVLIAPGARVTLWPVVGVSAGPVRLANADWGAAPDMLVAERIDIGLDPLALLDGRLRLTEIGLAAPQILLEWRADGQGNWMIRPEAAVEPEPATETGTATDVGAQITLDRVHLRDGRLRFLDHAAGRELDLTGLDLTLTAPELNGPARLLGKGLLRGQPLDLNLDLETLSGLLSGQVTGLSARLQAGGNEIGFAGRAGLSPVMAEGAVTLALPDRPALAALIGRALPDLPEGFGANTLALEAALSLTAKGSLHLRGAELHLDDRRIAADLDWLPGGARPKLLAKLTTETLALPIPAAADADSAEAGWSTEPFQADWLGALDADLALVAQSVQIGPAHLGPTRARLTLEDARGVLTLTKAEAWGGQIEGLIVLNGRKGLSASADLTATDLDLQTALTQITGSARLAGQGNARLKVLAVGTTQDAMIRSLKGETLLQIGKGEVVGLDIAGMLRTMDPGYVGAGRRTLFDSLSVTGKIEGGIWHSDDLALMAKGFSTRGVGSVDLGGRMVEYRLLPRLGDTGGEVPVLIRGPWAGPQVRLDLEWLASERAKAEAARAEALAKARLEALAQEKLGVTRQQGEDLEGAAKRKLEEAVKAETGRILDRILQGN